MKTRLSGTFCNIQFNTAGLCGKIWLSFILHSIYFVQFKQIFPPSWGQGDSAIFWEISGSEGESAEKLQFDVPFVVFVGSGRHHGQCYFFNDVCAVQSKAKWKLSASEGGVLKTTPLSIVLKAKQHKNTHCVQGACWDCRFWLGSGLLCSL